MSHACVLIAISPEQLAEAGGDIEAAVAHQMEPFSEAGEWFTDGSRWDWYQLGGRYTGFLSDYDPEKDLRNYNRCHYCRGTGSRPGSELCPTHPTPYGHPVIGRGCNACGGTGWDLKWPTDWVKADGDIVLRKDLKKSDFCSYAFLRDRRWCENERMGWFGATTTTECQRAASEDCEEYQGRCIHEHAESGAKVVNWGEDDERWKQLFFPRFIRDLHPDTTLVVVDYHV